MIERAVKFWTEFWAPSIHASTLALFRFLLFFLGVLLIDRPPYNSTLYTMEHWNPVGFFRIFAAPFLSFQQFDWIWSAWLVVAILAALGCLYRITGPLAAVLITFVTGYDYNFGHIYHSYHIYALTALIIGLSPAANALSVDKILFKTDRPTKSWTYGLPLRLVKVHVVWIMMVNGCAKLYHSGPQWIFSDNLMLHAYYVTNLPDRTEYLMANAPGVFQVLAGAVILIQLTCWLSLFQKHLALLYALSWSGFHFGVTYVFGGHTAFYCQMIVYLGFILFFWDKEFEELLQLNRRPS